MLKRLKLALKILLIIASYVGVIVLTILAVLYRPICNEFEYTESELNYYVQYLYSEYNPYLLVLSNSEYKNKVDLMFGNPQYNYLETELDLFKLSGFSATILNTIVIDDDLKYMKYCETLTHEILHYQYSSSNEKHIEFLTFKNLYESNDEQLHNVGVFFGITKLEQENKNEYWCKDLIINYLRTK